MRQWQGSNNGGGPCAAAIGLGMLALVALPGASALAAPIVGEPAPAFQAEGTNGEAIDLEALKGRTVVLEWTNHQCPYVRKHYETSNMQTLQAEAREKGIVWISIVSSAPGRQGHVDSEAANRLTEERGAHPTSVVLDPDGSIGKLYKASATPQMFVIDQQGKVAYMGAIDDNSSSRHKTVETADNYVRLAIDALLEGRAVETTETRPYGCTVKYGS